MGYNNGNYLLHDRNSSTRKKCRNLMEKDKPEYTCGLFHERSPKYGFWKYRIESVGSKFGSQWKYVKLEFLAVN